MAIAAKMKLYVDKGSMIRKMFEEGARLRKIHGADKVFDFSLGNPNLPPPAAVRERLAALAAADEPGLHAYMPNAGLEETRTAIAARTSVDHGVASRASMSSSPAGPPGRSTSSSRPCSTRATKSWSPRPTSSSTASSRTTTAGCSSPSRQSPTSR